MNTESAFVKVLETDSFTDVAQIKSVLEGQNVKYYLQGENMMYLRPLDPVRLMVAAENVDKVIELLKPLKLSYLKFRWEK